MRTIAQVIASTLGAMENCVASGNHEWHEKHGDTLAAIMDRAPSGSGFDSGTTLEGAYRVDRLVFHTSFHHMNDGYYDGWTDHDVVVTPSFDGIDVRVTGRNRNEIKEYIGDVFYEWLRSPEKGGSP